MIYDDDFGLPDNVIHILSKEYGDKDPVTNKYTRQKRKEAEERKRRNKKVLSEYRIPNPTNGDKV